MNELVCDNRGMILTRERRKTLPIGTSHPAWICLGLNQSLLTLDIED